MLEDHICTSCKGQMPTDTTQAWWGESGKPYCSEDCMNDCDDAPEEYDEDD